MTNELSPVEEMLLRLWRENYPFLYWANRINKINPLNQHDEMEAVFTLLQLADTYVTNLVAILQNPYEPWYFVKERTYEEHITNTLDQFKLPEEGRIELRNYERDLENVTGFTPSESWEVIAPEDNWGVRPVDVLLFELLGCPGHEEYEEKQLIFHENPGLYIDLCNGVINFRQQWKPLLNDLKHGFRLLPFQWDALDELNPSFQSSTPGFDLDEKREEYEATKEDYVYFWRLEGGLGTKYENDEAIPAGFAPSDHGLFVYRIELSVCTGLARTILSLLHNLIRTNSVPIQETIKPLVDETGKVDTFERFLTSMMLTQA